MEVLETKLQGVYILENFQSQDLRGSFIKIYHSEQLKMLNMNIKEVNYSISKKDVIRGLHFQKTPFEQEKIVTAIRGRLIDVIVDIRKESPTYGEYIAYELSETNKRSIFIPKGFAHGFKALEDNTYLMYLASDIYNKELESGIRWNSIGYDWETDKPIVSEKDKNLEPLETFISPF